VEVNLSQKSTLMSYLKNPCGTVAASATASTGRFRPPQVLGYYVTKFVPLWALKLITFGQVDF
jgi:hypothetical protein